MLLNAPDILNILFIRVHNTKYLRHFKGVQQAGGMFKCQKNLIRVWQKKFYQFFCGPKDEGIVLILIRTVMAVDMTSVTVEGKK